MNQAIKQGFNLPTEQHGYTYSVTVGVTSVIVLRMNPDRLWASIVNDSDTVIYISFSTPAALNQGIRLNANGGTLVLGKATDIPFVGEVNAICSVAAKVLIVTEG